jgi:hypothetical protein
LRKGSRRYFHASNIRLTRSIQLKRASKIRRPKDCHEEAKTEIISNIGMTARS